MLKRLLGLFRPSRSPAETVVPETVAPAPPPAPPSPPTPHATVRDHDDAAWERYEERETAGEYTWTYDGVTVTYRDASWQHHEPDTYRPKPIGERFYNELSPDHVDRLLSKTGRSHLEEAAHVAYMRRAHSDEARALADLLTRQCIETYPGRCNPALFEWRAKLLVEQGLTAQAVQLLTQRLDVCRDATERERLLKALHRAERKVGRKATRKQPDMSGPAAR